MSREKIRHRNSHLKYFGRQPKIPRCMTLSAETVNRSWNTHMTVVTLSIGSDICSKSTSWPLRKRSACACYSGICTTI